MMSKTQSKFQTARTCLCPASSGGSVTCEANQLAVCRVRNGAIEASCSGLPDTLGTRDEIRRWCYDEITRKPKPRLTSSDEMMLDSGIYMDFSSGANVRFRLPIQAMVLEPSAGSSYPAH